MANSSKRNLYRSLLCLILSIVLSPSDCLSQPELAIRLNKVFSATHSRRQSDALIASGRVSVNGAVVHDMGRRVLPYVDCVSLDGVQFNDWEDRVVKLQSPPVIKSTTQERTAADSSHLDDEEYIKFWKPVGVTSTTDLKIPGNLIEALGQKKGHRRARDSLRHRIFSIGRLDKDSSGLLLLTSDGRVPDSVLRKQWKQPKVYEVTVNKPITSSHISQLRRGLVITTDKLQGGRHVQFTAPTLPCRVKVLDGRRGIIITLTEGRNRQIRVMLQTLGYRVTDLHRVEFLGIGMQGLQGPGDWKRLNTAEREILEAAVVKAHHSKRIN